MIVYIYERLSNNIHRYSAPSVTRGQVINPIWYASNGYLVLMPDIAYKIGSPGQSALQVRVAGDPGGGGQGLRRRKSHRHPGPVVGRLPDRLHGHADESLQSRRGRRAGDAT